MLIDRIASRIAGKDCQHDEWVTVLDSSVHLSDPKCAQTLLQKAGDPATVRDDPRVTTQVGITTKEQMELALSMAHTAQPRWEQMGMNARRTIIEAVRQAIISEFDTFIELVCREGHPRSLAEWELQGALSMTSPESVDTACHFMKHQVVVDGREITVQRRSDGVVGFHPPKNAPASSSMLGLLVLLAGNAVVMKAPRSHPAAVSWLWSTIIEPTLREHGAPEGLVAVTCGRPDEILKQWVDSKYCNDIFYIGGSQYGFEWERRAIAAGKKPVLELEGNDHLIVTGTADVNAAAESANECFYGSGQICMVPKNVWVEESIASEFIECLKNLAGELSPGPVTAPGNRLSPVLRADEMFEVMADAVDAGSSVVTGGSRVNIDNVRDENGIFVRPTVLSIEDIQIAEGLRCIEEETFFPLLPVVTYHKRELDRVLQIVNTSAHGLRASIWSDDDHEIKRFVETVSNCGILKINDSHTGMTKGMPTHGGTGVTGGAFGELNMPMVRTSHAQAVVNATGANRNGSSSGADYITYLEREGNGR